MKANYGLGRIGSAASGGFSGFEAATRYLKGKDRKLIEENYANAMIPRMGADNQNIPDYNRDIRDHNKTILRAAFDRASELLEPREPLGTSKEVLRKARHNMVRYQLHHCGVTDEKILQAFKDIERDDFIPSMVGQTAAYVDKTLPVCSKRWNVEPRVLARMFQAAEIQEDSNILDVACSTGYSTAILSKLGGFVAGVDSIGEAVLGSRILLEKAGCYNVNTYIHDLMELDTLEGSYDMAFITGGAVTQIPDGLVSKVKDRGKIYAIIREDDSPFTPGKVMVYMKIDGKLTGGYPLFDAQVPMMPDFNFEPGFMEKFMRDKIA